MIYIILMVLAGIIAGFLFVRFVLTVPKLYRVGFPPIAWWILTGMLVVVIPVCVHLLLPENIQHKNEALIAYFLSLSITSIILIVIISSLLIGVVRTDSMPETVAKSFRRSLLLRFYLGGYRSIRKHIQSLTTTELEGETKPPNQVEQKKQLDSCKFSEAEDLESTLSKERLDQVIDTVKKANRILY